MNFAYVNNGSTCIPERSSALCNRTWIGLPGKHQIIRILFLFKSILGCGKLGKREINLKIQRKSMTHNTPRCILFEILRNKLCGEIRFIKIARKRINMAFYLQQSKWRQRITMFNWFCFSRCNTVGVYVHLRFNCNGIDIMIWHESWMSQQFFFRSIVFRKLGKFSSIILLWLQWFWIRSKTACSEIEI